MLFLDFFSTGYVVLVSFLIETAVAIHILLNKRDDSVSAALWLMIVYSIPGLGIVLYLLFGINRIQTLGRSIKFANDLMRTERGDPIHKALSRHLEEQGKYVFKEFHGGEESLDWNRTFDRLLSDTAPLSGNKLELLRDGDMTYPLMLEAINNAKSSIHLECYLVMGDKIGKIFFEALVRKAREGVKVKVLYDQFGSAFAFFAMFFRKYANRAPNLKLVPFAHTNLFFPWRIQLRNHRKLMVVDGNVAFVGGINLADGNLHRKEERESEIHDIHCMIRGPAVGEFQFCFLRDWCYATDTAPAGVFTEELFPVMRPCGDEVVRVIASGPGHEHEASEKSFLAAAATARRSIWLMTPYFVPGKPFVTALCVAVARGVDVRLILPRKNNHWYMRYASMNYYARLLEGGVRIFERTGTFSHSKAMLVDGSWAFMGSSNCDIRSFRLNYELDFAAFKGVFIDNLRTQFVEEMSHSEEITLTEALNKKLHTQLLESFCSLFSPIL
ncbi:MAG: cardiolipin synthase [Lentisphaerae bacterium GWF2_52_8]|nr:MAG: cardiolipin synthase [Lentisphaerae bacterium GWF2_52_8]